MPQPTQHKFPLTPSRGIPIHRRLGQAFGAAGSGAMSGFLVGNVPGAIIGGAVGLLSGLFSESPAEARDRRINMYRSRLKEMRIEAVKTATQNISKATIGQMNVGGAAAARRAISQGRTGDIEEVTAPITSSIGNRGVEVQAQALQDVNRAYDAADLQAEQEVFGAPLSPTLSDYVTTLAPNVAEFGAELDMQSNRRALIGEDIKDRAFYRRLYEEAFNREAADVPVVQPLDFGEIGVQRNRPAGFSRFDSAQMHAGDNRTPFRLPMPRNRRQILRQLTGG